MVALLVGFGMWFWVVLVVWGGFASGFASVLQSGKARSKRLNKDARKGQKPLNPRPEKHLFAVWALWVAGFS